MWFVDTFEYCRPAASYQPSEHSDFSFDNLSTTTDNNIKQPHSLPPPAQLQQSQSRNVQRSVSQPECAAANEKSLFRWVDPFNLISEAFSYRLPFLGARSSRRSTSRWMMPMKIGIFSRRLRSSSRSTKSIKYDKFKFNFTVLSQTCLFFSS